MIRRFRKPEHISVLFMRNPDRKDFSDNLGYDQEL